MSTVEVAAVVLGSVEVSCCVVEGTVGAVGRSYAVVRADVVLSVVDGDGAYGKGH